MTYDQSNLREGKLLQILDILHDSDVPLTISQIQYRLGANKNVTMSREEIEAHLWWGAMQPNATNSPIRPAHARTAREWQYQWPESFRGGWFYVEKHPTTIEETK